MSFLFRKRKRFDRVASFDLPPSQWERAWSDLRRRDVLGRIALAFFAAIAMCAVIHGWNPPFPYRLGYVPARDIVATVAFTKSDPVATEAAQERARNQTRYVYRQDAQLLVQLRAKLRNTLSELASASTLDKLDPEIWRSFKIPAAQAKPLSAKQQEDRFREFRDAFVPQERLDRVEKALAEVFAIFEERGLLDKLSEDFGQGNELEIVTYPRGRVDLQRIVRVSDVMISDGTAAIHEGLRKHPDLAAVAERLFAWIAPRLKPTLVVDDELTKAARDKAVRSIGEVEVIYSAGQTLAKADVPLERVQMELLHLEYAAAMAQRPPIFRIDRATAIIGLIFTGFLLCGLYMRYRHRGPLASLTRLVVLLLMALAATAVACWASTAPWRGELVPVLFFGMTMAIVYRQELALLLSGVVVMVVSLAIGHSLQEFIILTGVTATAVLNLGNIRSRSKLIHVGFSAGVAAGLLYIAMAMLDDQPLDLPLLKDATRDGLWALAAGFLVTGLLPFIENLSSAQLPKPPLKASTPGACSYASERIFTISAKC
jgi:membrane-associated HD superfamily phosphohydrolase